MRTRSIDLSWQVLRKASDFFGAKTYIGETGLTTPPFFPNVRRGAKIMWGALDDSPVIVNWNGLDPSEQAYGSYSHIHWARRRPPLPLSRYRTRPPLPLSRYRPVRSGIFNMGSSESKLIHICLSPDKHDRNPSQLGPIQPGLDSVGHEH